jgi:3-methyladenine DNA glycosylase Mpg
MPSLFSDALRALVAPADADEPAWRAAIAAIADLVLTQTTWKIAGQPHRVTEVEFYVNAPGHRDAFTHDDPMQREFARWYHHRTGLAFRSGTYKGLDLAFGREDASAAMLIRAIEALDEPRARFDGPCVCVDHLLALVGHSDVRSFVASYDRAVDELPGSPSALALVARRPVTIVRSARVGLSLKRGATAERVRFLAAPYRFLTDPTRSAKGRLHVACALFREGRSAEEISAITGTRLAQVRRYVAQYERGRTLDPESFRRDLSADETAQLLGACERFAP